MLNKIQQVHDCETDDLLSRPGKDKPKQSCPQASYWTEEKLESTRLIVHVWISGKEWFLSSYSTHTKNPSDIEPKSYTDHNSLELTVFKQYSSGC